MAVYWKFALAEKEFYQLMFGIEINSSGLSSGLSQSRLMASMIKEVIHELVPGKDADDNKVFALYYSFLSVVHGLVCLNMTGHRTPETMSNQITRHTFTGIIKSIRIS